MVISGGYNEEHVFSDVWRLDLKLLQWTRLRESSLPCPLYFHSTALTPEGRMYTFGGIIKENDEVTNSSYLFRFLIFSKCVFAHGRSPIFCFRL